jgi:D-3-phosphoglycerate dehydrogenase
MRLLIADKFPEAYVQDFQSLGLEVAYEPELDAHALVAAAATAQILVVRSTKVTRAVIEASKRLELVIRAGAGFDTIDVVAASERGIYVANCPGKNSVAVAELTMGLLLALDRRIVHQASDLSRGKWNKHEYGKADGLKGKTMGLAGSGPIAQAVAKRAAAFDMRVVMWSRSLTPERAEELGVGYAPTLYDLAESSHVVSVHLAQAPETKRLFNADFFSHMGDGTIFINTSRGGLHDEGALVLAMKERGLRVALDVYEAEPASGTADFTKELFSLPGFVGTHHVGASTEQAQNAIAHESVRICREYVTRGHAPNAVNIEKHSAAKVQLIVRHLDKVGVLASVLGIIRNHGLNIEEMTNTIFEGSKAAVAVIRLSGIPDESVVHEIASLEDQILHVEAKAAR